MLNLVLFPYWSPPQVKLALRGMDGWISLLIVKIEGR